MLRKSCFEAGQRPRPGHKSQSMGRSTDLLLDRSTEPDHWDSEKDPQDPYEDHIPCCA